MKAKYVVSKNIEINGMIDLNEDGEPIVIVEGNRHLAIDVINSLVGYEVSIKGSCEE